MAKFKGSEKKILEPFFTNMDKPIFALKNLPEVVKGALFSRYSRSAKSLRKLLLDEFIRDKKMGFEEIVSYQVKKGEDQTVAIKKAEEFYDRVLVGYGDDSVAELGGAHIAIEDISVFGTKFIEHSRLGLSPLEKSTRYVFFNEKVGGKYKYYREPKIMGSKFADDYEGVMDALFDFYSKSLDFMKKYFTEVHPQADEVSDRAYRSTIKAKSCDTLRGLLPISVLTNMGVFGNGRAFEYLIVKMNSYPLAESKMIASEMLGELGKVIPSFVKRAGSDYGKRQSDYFSRNVRLSEMLVESITTGLKPEKSGLVKLVDFDEKAEDKILRTIIYEFSQLSEGQCIEIVKRLTKGERDELLKRYVGERLNRRHRPGRAFEEPYYKFDILANFGVFKDMMRHRILSQQKQLLTTKYGFDIPKDIVSAGLGNEFSKVLKDVDSVFTEISMKMPKEAQYLVTHGHRNRFYMRMNLREAFHLIELRTIEQGHPDYRLLAQKMFKEVKKVHPNLAKFMNHVDMNTYDLERLESEKKLDKKIAALRKKYGN